MELVSNLPDTTFYCRLRRLDAPAGAGWTVIGTGASVTAELRSGGRYEIKAHHAGYDDLSATFTEPIKRFRFSFLEADTPYEQSNRAVHEVGELQCDLSKVTGVGSLPARSLAVMDFSTGKGVTGDTGRGLADLCRATIQNTGCYILVNRESIVEILGGRGFCLCDSVRQHEVSCELWQEASGRKRWLQAESHEFGQALVLAIELTDVSTASVEGFATETVFGQPEELTIHVRDLTCELLLDSLGGGD